MPALDVANARHLRSLLRHEHRDQPKGVAHGRIKRDDLLTVNKSEIETLFCPDRSRDIEVHVLPTSEGPYNSSVPAMPLPVPRSRSGWGRCPVSRGRVAASRLHGWFSDPWSNVPAAAAMPTGSEAVPISLVVAPGVPGRSFCSA